MDFLSNDPSIYSAQNQLSKEDIQSTLDAVDTLMTVGEICFDMVELIIDVCN